MFIDGCQMLSRMICAGYVQQMVDVEQMVCCQMLVVRFFFSFLVAICRATGMYTVRWCIVRRLE